MKKSIAISALLVLICTVSAEAVFYHDVITFEHCAQNPYPKAVIANGHFILYIHEDPGVGASSYTDMLFPLDFGFAFDERWSVSFVLPLRYIVSWGADRKFAIANPWIKGKFIPMFGSNLSLGPRIAFRLPMGAGSFFLQSIAFDFAALVHMGYTTAFTLDAQLGMTLEFILGEYGLKNPSPIYFIAEPGYAFNPIISFNGVFGLAIPVIDGKGDGVTHEGANQYWAGEEFHFILSPNVTFNEVFSYRFGETTNRNDLYFGGGVTATIPH